MGEKDLSQKNLESFPDVFADCVNALLYKGEQVLDCSRILSAPTETLYPDAEDVLHNQFQDISKYEMDGSAIKAQYTIENQTASDSRMVLRKIGYEGAIYRRQYQEKEMYPVVSMLLYWGKSKWGSSCSLHELMKDKLTDKNKKYVDNVRILTYEMAHLTKGERERFRSDMRIVVDYLAEGGSYVPTEQKILHMDAFLRMMRILTGDDRYEEMLLKIAEEEKEGKIGMCELLDRYWNQGVEKGLTEGRVQGKAESIGNIRSMHEHKLSAEAIAELINQKAEYINQILSLCSRYPGEDDISIAKRFLNNC